jgi:hypothetical protein
MSPKELQELRERMSKQSDEELLKIVNVDFRDYRKESIEFARAEIEKRGLSHRLKINPAAAGILPKEQTKKQVELSPKMETVECRFCGLVISATATECDSCGYGTPHGVSLKEEQESERSVKEPVASPTESNPIRHRDSSAGAAGQVSALMKRYKDAYLVARVMNGFGKFIKVGGIVIAALLVLIGMAGINAAGRSGPYDRSMGPMGPSEIIPVLGVVAIVAGVIVGLFFYIVGILVSAQGQILKASLDSAVNNSPFLTNEHRAKIMSLPEA